MFLEVAGSTFDIRKVSLKFQLGVMPPFFLDVFVNEWVINSRVGTLFGEWKTLLTSQPTRSKIHAHWPRWNPQSIDSWQNHFHLSYLGCKIHLSGVYRLYILGLGSFQWPDRTRNTFSVTWSFSVGGSSFRISWNLGSLVNLAELIGNSPNQHIQILNVGLWMFWWNTTAQHKFFPGASQQKIKSSVWRNLSIGWLPSLLMVASWFGPQTFGHQQLWEDLFRSHHSRTIVPKTEYW